MGRNIVIAVVDPDGTERAVHRIQYGARMRVEDGEDIKRGQRIAEWDPYTRPILTEVEGTVAFEDLVEGQSMSESLDESTGIAKRVVIDWRTVEPRPPTCARDRDQGQGRQDPQARAWRRGPLPAGGRRHPLGRSRRQGEGRATSSRVSRPKAPRPATSPAVCRGWRSCSRRAGRRRPRSSPRSPARCGSARTTRTSAASRIEPNEKDAEPAEYLIPKGKHIHLQDGDVIEKGDYIVEGNPAPHDILAIKGVEELANYLVNEIQEVYRLQGVQINDKHIEVIVRQMLQKVEIDDAGETDLIHGEQIDKLEFDEINAKFVAEGKKPATAHPVLLGITKASLQTRSFISAASFQETTRVLTEAAVNGKADTLEGLKENVIVGRLIPAGTGAMMNRCARSRSSATSSSSRSARRKRRRRPKLPRRRPKPPRRRSRRLCRRPSSLGRFAAARNWKGRREAALSLTRASRNARKPQSFRPFPP